VIEPYGFTGEKQEVIDKLIDAKVEDLVNDHVCRLVFEEVWMADGRRPQYQNLTRDAGLHEVLAVCFNRAPQVRLVSLFPNR
jgi:hypothetical protein